MPYPNEHSCRLIDPKEFTTFRRKNNEELDNGKPLDVVYGIKNGKSRIQALRYAKNIWDKQDAEMHCMLRGGKFEPAKKVR